MRASSQLDRSLYARAEEYFQQGGFDTNDVGIGVDDQNGLHDDSLWIEDLTEKRRVREMMENDGWDTFEAPRDGGEVTFSTYGVRVPTLASVEVGDVVRVRPNWYAEVISVGMMEDGGPWKRKSRDFHSVTAVSKTGKTYLLIQPVDSDEVLLYSATDSTPSGYQKEAEQPETVYRVPRSSEVL